MARYEKKQEIGKTANKIADVSCMECKRITRHSILVSVDVNGHQEFDKFFTYYYIYNYQVIQCLGCETISFRKASSDSESYEYDEMEDSTVHAVEEDLYPNRDEGRTPTKDSKLLPPSIERIYQETIKAINNHQPVLTGIGIRAIVETVCKDKSANGKDLSEKINDLVKIGVLTLDGSKILHKIRTLGNEAAHEVKPHKAEQLSLALDVCEHLLQGVYILPHYAKQTFK